MREVWEYSPRVRSTECGRNARRHSTHPLISRTSHLELEPRYSCRVPLENAQVAIEEKVPLVNISLGKADWIAQGVHDYGGHVLATVTNAKHAEAALHAGADAIMCTGHEAAAHGGDVTTLCLIPSLAHYFPDVPLVAAGGFANGKRTCRSIIVGCRCRGHGIPIGHDAGIASGGGNEARHCRVFRRGYTCMETSLMEFRHES